MDTKPEGEERWQYFRRVTDHVGIHHLQALLDASRMMNTTLDLDRLFSMVVEIATHYLDAERSTLYLVDEKRGEIWSKVLEGEEWLQISLSIGQGLAGHVAQTGETINIEDAYEDPRFYRGVDELTGFLTKTVLCIPMLNRDRKTIGVIQVLNKKEGTFTEYDERFLEALSSHAALAIENALLYKEALEKQRLEHEMRIARDIQQQLLPTIDTTIGDYEIAASNVPCEEVGGDYYEVFHFGEHVIGFALGDVCGKGIPASLLTAATQAGLRALVHTDPTPHRLVSALNQVLHESTSISTFVSLFYGVLDLHTGALSYVNAGHNPPVLLRHGGTRQFLTTGGLLLGVEVKTDYEEGHVSVEPGDMVMLSTYGVTEAVNEDKEEFGLKQLLRILSDNKDLAATAIVEVIRDTLQQFTAGVPQYDDLTMIVIKRRRSE